MICLFFRVSIRTETLKKLYLKRSRVSADCQSLLIHLIRPISCITIHHLLLLMKVIFNKESKRINNKRTEIIQCHSLLFKKKIEKKIVPKKSVAWCVIFLDNSVIESMTDAFLLKVHRTHRN